MNSDTLPYALMAARIQKELEDYIVKNKLKALVLGISGGIDSALCAALASPVCSKLGIPLIGRSIPISTNTSEEQDRAEDIGNCFCTDFDEDYQLEGAYTELWGILEPAGWDIEDDRAPYRKGNLKARLRMILLYDLAQLHRGMVLSTDNYTELLLGFWTLHGDVGDYGMLQNLWKTEVYGLAEYVVSTLPKDPAEALQSCIDCQATDGLGISNTDLDQIMPGWEGTSRDGYKEVDRVLQSWLMLMENAAKTPNVINAMDKMAENPVIKRHLSSEFKRQNPTNIKRSVILPTPPKEHQKREIVVSVYHHNQDKPFTKEDLDKLNLENGDRIQIHYEDEEFRSDGGSPAGWYIEVERTRLETDEEFADRIDMHKSYLEQSQKDRYQRYLVLKKEFEK
jgi:NAD+ synthase